MKSMLVTQLSYSIFAYTDISDYPQHKKTTYRVTNCEMRKLAILFFKKMVS